MEQQVYAKKGFATLFSLIILIVISISVFSGIILVNIDSLNSIKSTREGIIARSLADSCMEKALNELKTDNTYSGDELLNYTEGSCEILPIQGSGNDDLLLRTIGLSGDSTKKIEVAIITVNPVTELSYYIETDF